MPLTAKEMTNLGVWTALANDIENEFASHVGLSASAENTWSAKQALANVDVVLGTGAGTKLGTAANQKLGFWGSTPVAQQVLATGAEATVDDVITLLQTLGLCKQE